MPIVLQVYPSVAITSRQVIEKFDKETGLMYSGQFFNIAALLILFCF
jgi:hypothetical protein